MTGYCFVYGMDGFGADVAPAIEEGVYLDYNKAFNHLKELNKNAINSLDDTSEIAFYEEGYGIDDYPEDDIECKKAKEEGNWRLLDDLIDKHKITDINKICEQLIIDDISNYEPPFGFYAMTKIDIIK